MLTAPKRRKNSRFLIYPKGMRNPHRNTKESFSRIFGMNAAALQKPVRGLFVVLTAKSPGAFSSEVVTGSREENAVRQ